MSVILLALQLDFKLILTLNLNKYNMHNVFKLCTVMLSSGFASGHRFDIGHQTQCKCEFVIAQNSN